MNRKYVALLVLLALLSSACATSKSGATTGSAPRTPFIGGTAGITMNFEKDNPPPEVTDDSTFSFSTIVDLKNDGEFKVDKNDMSVNLVGFDPNDFGKVFDDLRDVKPEDDLQSRKRDAEGNIVEGTTTFVNFPKSGDSFRPRKFSGNTEFTFRTDACYYYQTEADSKLCILKDMINVRGGSVCLPTSSKTIFSSSAPVQVTNLRQTVVGKDKISFSFDIVLSSNVDIFWSADANKPSTFDNGCPRDPRARRERESNVGVQITELPSDPIVTSLKCGGLDNPSSSTGVVRLVNRRRTVTCTAELTTDRLDLEKTMGIILKYNVLDSIEKKVLVKHLAEAP